MKHLTRLVTGVLSASLTFGMAACSASTPSTSTDNSLTFWIMGDSGANFQKLTEPFTKETGIAVNVTAIPWDSVDERLTTAVASGKGPDLLQIGLTKLRQFADAGALMKLDNELGSYPGLAASNFADAVAGQATAVGGSIVSIPWVADTRILYYRSDILGEAGITKPPATWEQLRKDAKTLADRGAGQYGYYIPQWDSTLPVGMTWSHGGDIVGPKGTIDFDSAGFNKMVDVYTGLYADGSVPLNADFDQAQGFVSGMAPMLISGPYLSKMIRDAAPELDGKWNVAMIPAGTQSSTSVFLGSSLGIWATTKQKDNALKLANFLSDPATQLKWYEIQGEIPTVKAALNDSTFTSDPMVKLYAQQLASSKVIPMVPNWDHGTGEELLNALNSIALNGADRGTALADLYKKTADTSAK
ncbi:MAG: extracellular solute-binding protein [Propionibacteriaceae bacterium]|jgi:multiple sugar transport system substrate-binding protein|nr:extracellular solute-binding protein [Propionibacteriaceae bacterium]